MPRPDWNLAIIRATETLALLPMQARSAQVDWGDVMVAHLDTGYTEHPGFGFGSGGSSWLLPTRGLNLLGPGLPRDPLDYEGNPGHGTRTCSVICGEAVQMPGEVPVVTRVSTAPGLPVRPCRVTESVVLLSKSRRDAVAHGIHHAIAQGCGVVSISLGVPGFPFFSRGGMGAAVDDAYEAGIIVVAAAGQITDTVCYPAKFNRTIGVGGVTPERTQWAY